jgi:Asp/Glu/hydantoin racemase
LQKNQITIEKSLTALKKKVAVIHTSLVLYESINNLFKEIMPDVTVMNFIEDTLLKDVIANDGLTPNITKRICNYVMQAETAGADVVLNACSSVEEAIDVAKRMVNIPCLKIDEPMAEEAVKQGEKIAVFGTVGTTLNPSTRLIETTAIRMGRVIEVTPYLVEGAFKILVEEKNPEKHNQMVLEVIHQVESKHDVIVLAQASMAILIPHLQGLGKPVLYSSKTGIERVKKVLYQCR